MKNLLNFITKPKVQLLAKRDDVLLIKTLTDLQEGLKQFKQEYDALSAKINTTQPNNSKSQDKELASLNKKVADLEKKLSELSKKSESTETNE